MPTYSYQCSKCNYRDEIFLEMSKRNTKRVCPKCNSLLIRLIGTGSGVIFKGSGFYETDHKQIKDSIKENKKMNEERNQRSLEDEDF